MKNLFIPIVLGIFSFIISSCNVTYKNMKLLSDDSIKFWQNSSILISFDKRNHVVKKWDDILSPSWSCIIDNPDDTFRINKNCIYIQTMDKLKLMKVIDISKNKLKYVWLTPSYSRLPMIYSTEWDQPVCDGVALSIVNDVINRLKDEFDNMESICIYSPCLNGVIPNSLPKNVVLLTPLTLSKQKSRKVFVISNPTQTYDMLHCWCGYGILTLDNYGSVLKYNYEMEIDFQYKKKNLKWSFIRRKKYIL